jgi:hypothetical protein
MIRDLEKHEDEGCDCDFCVALEESGLQVFRLTTSSKDDISSWNYFSFGKTQEDFESAVNIAKSRIDDMACTSEEVYREIHRQLGLSGFEYVGKFEEGYVWVEEKPPIERGFTFEIET